MEMIVYKKYVDDVHRLTNLKYTDFFVNNVLNPNFEKVNYNYKIVDDCNIVIISKDIFWYAIFSDNRKFRTTAIKPITNTKIALTLTYQPSLDTEYTIYDGISENFDDIPEEMYSFRGLGCGARYYSEVITELQPKYIIFQLTNPILSGDLIGEYKMQFHNIEYNTAYADGFGFGGYTRDGSILRQVAGARVFLNNTPFFKDYFGTGEIDTCLPTYLMEIPEGHRTETTMLWLDVFLKQNMLVCAYFAPSCVFDDLGVVSGAIIELLRKNPPEGTSEYLASNTVYSITTYKPTFRSINLRNEYPLRNLGECDISLKDKTINLGSGILNYMYIPTAGFGFMFMCTVSPDVAISTNNFILEKYGATFLTKQIDYSQYRTNLQYNELYKTLYETSKTTYDEKLRQINASGLASGLESIAEIGTGIALMTTGDVGMVTTGLKSTVSGINNLITMGSKMKIERDNAKMQFIATQTAVSDKMNQSGGVSLGDLIGLSEVLQTRTLPTLHTYYMNEKNVYNYISTKPLLATKPILSMHIKGSTYPQKFKCERYDTRAERDCIENGFVFSENLYDFINSLGLAYY